MALTKTMCEALNKQFNEELNSGYLYDSMAAAFYAMKLPGFAMWMTAQAQEEREHAIKIHRYLDEQGERVFHGGIAEPQTQWKNALDVMKAALAHEKYISKRIHDLVRLAQKENDLPTEGFLGWYVAEQVEEESTAQSLIDKLEMVGDNRFGLYQLDKEVSTRQ